VKKRFLSKPSLSYGGAHAITYPTPANLNYLFNFGSMCGVVLISQVVSGFLLTVHYIPSIEYAFDSIEYIMRKVKYG
jgi:quinol-cytochrome oxidoreductase complex cytochrome b subunit